LLVDEGTSADRRPVAGVSRLVSYDWQLIGPRAVDMCARRYPRGGFKLVHFRGYVEYESVAPGGLGLLGLLSNKLIFRGAWVVEVAGTAVRSDPRARTRFVVANRVRSEQLLAEIARWLRGASTMDGFTSAIAQSVP
jgi:hypothetical protein